MKKQKEKKKKKKKLSESSSRNLVKLASICDQYLHSFDEQLEVNFHVQLAGWQVKFLAN